MAAISPKQFEGRLSKSTDYHTGRVKTYFDVDIPDRQAHEPHNVRAMAEQIGTRTWSVHTVHGPHDEKDQTGSYYRSGERTTIEGKAAGAMGQHVERLARQAAVGVVKARQG